MSKLALYESMFDRPAITEVIDKLIGYNGMELSPRFSSKRSQIALHTVHYDLVKICNIVIEYMDFSALEGARTLDMQKHYFAQGRSKLDGVTKRSKHQVSEDSPLSFAIDIAPYPIDFKDEHKAKARFYMLAGRMKMASEFLIEAGEISHKLVWGGDWNSDNIFTGNWDDLPHFQLESL